MYTIKDLENRKGESMETFKEFYKYFKTYDYSISLARVVKMYAIYVR